MENSQFLKSIDFSAHKSRLWQASTSGRKAIVKLHSLLPKFKIPSRILSILKSPPEGKQVAYLLGTKDSPQHFLHIQITECSSSPKAKAYLKLCRKKPGIDELESICSGIHKQVDSEADQIEPTDLCRVFVRKKCIRGSLVLSASMVFPHATFQYQQIPNMSIVSTPLAAGIISGEGSAFRSGFLTMDQKRRVLLLTVEDLFMNRYPVIGVWVTNIPNVNKNFPFTHPLVWALCVRYIQSSKTKISNDPQRCSFLLVYFGESTHFYEVSTTEKPFWAVASANFSEKEKVLIEFSKNEKRKEYCSLSPRAQKLVQKQKFVLKQLQRQVHNLQSQLSSPVLI